MSDGRGRGPVREVMAPVGVVGSGAAASAMPLDRGRAEARPADDEGAAFPTVRRFEVPSTYPSPAGRPLSEMVALRKMAREGVLRLGVDQTTILLFGEPGSPVRQVARFRHATRAFQKLESHSPGLVREAKAMLEAVSRVEVADVRETAPPPGPMRDYLRKADIRGLLALPLRHDDRMVGFVSFEVVSRPRRWSAEERDQARIVAEQVESILSPDLLDSVAEAWPPDPSRHDPLRPPPGRARDEAEETGVTPPLRASEALDPRTGSVRTGASAPSGSEDAAPSGAEDAVGADTSVPEPTEPGPAPTRARESRVSKLRPLEGAALLGADMGEDLLHLVEVQEATLALLATSGDPAGKGPEGAAGTDEVMADLREISNRLRRGIASVVQMTRSGRVEGEVTDLNQLLTSLIHRLAGIVGDGPRFVVSPASGPIPVRIEPMLLERALEHLIRNARAAVAPGDRIRISWDRSGTGPGDPELGGDLESASDGRPREFVRIRVRDEGQGIRPHHLPWVFQPYFSQPAEDTGAGPPGLHRGLGLSTVQAIVEGHGGWVDLQSHPGEGTIVDLHLPLADPEDAWRPDRGPKPDPKLEPASPVVLLVEDEPLLARLLQRILTRDGCRVIIAASAPEASRRWREWGSEIDLVIVELRLAGVPDPDAMVREWSERTGEVPVAVLDRIGEPKRSLPAGIEPAVHLHPPFEPAELGRRIRALLAV